MDVFIGNRYRNKKHGTIYQVLGFARHSETEEVMVQYEREEPEARETIPWDRPLWLFREKFEEL